MIIQDMQNDVISDGGAFAADGGYEHAQSQNVIENVARLALRRVPRSAGVPVIHVHYVVDPGAPGLKQNAGPLPRRGRNRTRSCVGRGAPPQLPGLEPQDGDIVVEKMRTSAFYNPPA